MATAVVIASGQSLVDRWFRTNTGLADDVPAQSGDFSAVTGFQLGERIASGATTVRDMGDGTVRLDDLLAADRFALRFLEASPQYEDVIVVRASKGASPILKGSGNDSFFDQTLPGSQAAAGDGTGAFDGVLTSTFVKPAIDAALEGRSDLDLVGIIWSQGEEDIGALGQDVSDPGIGTAVEDAYRAGLLYVLDEIVAYTLAMHGDRFTAQTAEPRHFIQHLGQRAVQTAEMLDGSMDVQRIQREVAAGHERVVLATESYDLPVPDGLHPTAVGFHVLADRMARAVTLDERGPVAIRRQLDNDADTPTLSLTLSIADGHAAGDLRAGDDPHLLVVEDAGGSVDVLGLTLEGAVATFTLVRPLTGASTVSYADAAATTDAALTDGGDGDALADPIHLVSDHGSLPLFNFSSGFRVVDTGGLRAGVAALDTATLPGFLMFAEDGFGTRIAPHAANADKFVAVRHDSESGDWFYDNNSGYVPFAPAEGDVLVAGFDPRSDTFVNFAGLDFDVVGVSAGYLGGDIVLTSGQFGGQVNPGEFDIEGTNIALNDGIGAGLHRFADVGALATGIAARDNATGSGYLMYSSETGGLTLHSANVERFFAVVYDAALDQWLYDDNSGLVPFDPAADDVLVAAVDFDADTIHDLKGMDFTLSGVRAGYADGDMAFHANQFAGRANAGEFDLTGSMLILHDDFG